MSTFAVLAALALEIVAAGRVLPNLRRGPEGYEAVWEPLLNGADDGRVRAVTDSLPPVCRSLTAEGVPPGGDRPARPGRVRRCGVPGFAGPRRGLRSSGCRARASDPAPPALESWLIALASPSPTVVADPDELAKLEQLIGEWRADAAARGGSFRLCLRLHEPPDDGAADDGSGSRRQSGPATR